MAKKENKETKPDALETAIKAYLDKRAAEDQLFAASYAKEKKSIKECCTYIRGEAKKLSSGNVAVVDDATVYGWAVHYYDEDNIKVDGTTPAKVATPKSKTNGGDTPRTGIKKSEDKNQKEPEKPKVGDQLSLFDFI